MTAVAPTDRLKSVRNSCVIKVFGGVFMLSRCFLDCFCGCRVFCHRTESDLFLFLLPFCSRMRPFLKADLTPYIPPLYFYSICLSLCTYIPPDEYHAWFHWYGYCGAMRNGKQAKSSKWKYTINIFLNRVYFSTGNRTSDPLLSNSAP